MLDRKDIDPKYKWDLTKIYPTEEDFKADFEEAEALVKAFPAHEKTMTKSAKGLLAVLLDDARLDYIISKLWTYSHLHFETDNSNNLFQARAGRVRSLAISASAAGWFVSPYILRLDEATVEAWIKEEPGLETFRRILSRIMSQKPHTLSDECEKLVANMGDALGSHGGIRGIFANADLQFGKIRDENGKYMQLTDTNYVPTLMKPQRNVRRAAFNCLYKTYGQFGNTFATMFEGYVKERRTLSKLHNFGSSLEASTFRDEVTPVIYNNLIKSVRKSLPVIHDYYELKREVLGLDRLHMYDVYAPLIGECDKKYSYEEAVEEVLETVNLVRSITPPSPPALRKRVGLTFIPPRVSAAARSAQAVPAQSPTFSLTTPTPLTISPPSLTRQVTLCTPTSRESITSLITPITLFS